MFGTLSAFFLVEFDEFFWHAFGFADPGVEFAVNDPSVGGVVLRMAGGKGDEPLGWGGDPGTVFFGFTCLVWVWLDDSCFVWGYEFVVCHFVDVVGGFGFNNDGIAWFEFFHEHERVAVAAAVCG